MSKERKRMMANETNEAFEDRSRSPDPVFRIYSERMIEEDQDE